MHCGISIKPDSISEYITINFVHCTIYLKILDFHMIQNIKHNFDKSSHFITHFMIISLAAFVVRPLNNCLGQRWGGVGGGGYGEKPN